MKWHHACKIKSLKSRYKNTRIIFFPLLLQRSNESMRENIKLWPSWNRPNSQHYSQATSWVSSGSPAMTSYQFYFTQSRRKGYCGWYSNYFCMLVLCAEVASFPCLSVKVLLINVGPKQERKKRKNRTCCLNQTNQETKPIRNITNFFSRLCASLTWICSFDMKWLLSLFYVFTRPIGWI